MVKKSRDKDKHNIDILKEFIGIIRVDWIYVLLIFLGVLLTTVFYVLNARNIYESTTVIKITKPQGSILTSSPIPEFQDFGFLSDRYISNEIEVLKSFSIRSLTAKTLLDSAEANGNISSFYHLLNDPDDLSKGLKNEFEIAKMLKQVVQVVQKKGLDVVDLSVESPSPYEAAIICNAYAKTYSDYSLEFSRLDLTNIINYLNTEKEKKFRDLKLSEAALEDFQQREGVVQLDVQADELVRSLSAIDKEKTMTSIELAANEKKYSELSQKIDEIDPKLKVYLESEISKGYLPELQKQIAQLEIERELQLSIISNDRVRQKAKEEYDRKISSLQESLDKNVKSLDAGMYVMTPEERREMVWELVKTGVMVNSDRIKNRVLGNYVNEYETRFNKLPSQIIEYARLERDKLTNEKIYILLEEKYQEALINQNARIGNVTIIDPAFESLLPSKPNRVFLLVSGAVFGLILGIGFVITRNYLDKSIKTPDDLENNGYSILAWIPSIDIKEKSDLSSPDEFIVASDAKSSISEAFKVLRTRVQYAKIEEEPLKTILITSTIPGEGKTTVAVNLAGSFALDGKNVLLIDCDLRKPRVHSVMGVNRYPGLTDLLFGNNDLSEVIRPTKFDNMHFIPSGTIPPNPSELLGSLQMKKTLENLKTQYDIIVLDSPPSISVTDSEILFKITDGTLLVVQSLKTPMDAFSKVYDRFNSFSEPNLLGTVLNNFSYKRNYGYYYNYYYYSSGEKPN